MYIQLRCMFNCGCSTVKNLYSCIPYVYYYVMARKHKEKCREKLLEISAYK